MTWRAHTIWSLQQFVVSFSALTLWKWHSDLEFRRNESDIFSIFFFFELRFSKTPLIVQVHNSRHSFRKFLFISITTKNTEIFSMLCVKRVVPNINDHCQVVMNPSGLVSNDWALCWFSIGTSWIYIVEPIGTARQSGVAYVITYGKEI